MKQVIYRCRRCQELHVVDVLNALITAREAVDRGHTIASHTCADGAYGVTDLIGTAPPPKL